EIVAVVAERRERLERLPAQESAGTEVEVVCVGAGGHRVDHRVAPEKGELRGDRETFGEAGVEQATQARRLESAEIALELRARQVQRPAFALVQLEMHGEETLEVVVIGEEDALAPAPIDEAAEVLL